MAQIDIKNCNVFIRDGYAGPGGAGGLINLMAGYMAGATSIATDGFVGAVAVGDTFQIAGETPDTVHTVVTHSETSMNTTLITFTPALAGVVADDAVITILPHQITVRIGEGNMMWTEKRPVVYVKDRGLLDTVRLGDQEPVEVKMDATWVFLTSNGSEPPTIENALKKTGAAANWISSSLDPCEPYAVNIVVVYIPPCTTVGELYVMHDYRYEDIGHDLKKGDLAMSGKCNVITSTNIRQTGEY